SGCAGRATSSWSRLAPSGPRRSMATKVYACPRKASSAGRAPSPPDCWRARATPGSISPEREVSSSLPEASTASTQPLKDELLNLPNMITYLRVLVIPLFLWLVWRGDPLSSVLAASLFALAAISDVLDGWLARRMNRVSVVGKLMDPLADKLIVTASLVMLAQMGRIEAWLVIVILSRELIVSGLR